MKAARAVISTAGPSPAAAGFPRYKAAGTVLLRRWWTARVVGPGPAVYGQGVARMDATSPPFEGGSGPRFACETRPSGGDGLRSVSTEVDMRGRTGHSLAGVGVLVSVILLASCKDSSEPSRDTSRTPSQSATTTPSKAQTLPTSATTSGEPTPTTGRPDTTADPSGTYVPPPPPPPTRTRKNTPGPSLAPSQTAPPPVVPDSPPAPEVT